MSSSQKKKKKLNFKKYNEHHHMTNNKELKAWIKAFSLPFWLANWCIISLVVQKI